jgi:hypothetical protein
MTQQKIETPKNTPLRDFRAGGVRATVWENTHQGPRGVFTIQTVTVERTYKAGEEWKKTNSYSLADIQKLRYVLSQAEAYLLSGEKEDAEEVI